MEIISSQKLKDAMINKAIGVNALARAANIQPNIISRLLKGVNSNIRLSTLGKISAALNVPATDLLSEET